VSLSEYPIDPQIAVTEIDRASAFYEGALGLVPTGKQHPGTRTYACGVGTLLHLYATPHAGKRAATVAQWRVENLDALITTLTASGVHFEQYEQPPTDPSGVHDSGYGRVAWFKDPDGNTFALEGDSAP
jgi:catechol 2,3-dioxygenase-like lactoylglutathione lyase family enzyme